MYSYHIIAESNVEKSKRYTKLGIIGSLKNNSDYDFNEYDVKQSSSFGIFFIFIAMYRWLILFIKDAF